MSKKVDIKTPIDIRTPEYNSTLLVNHGKWNSRLLIGTPMTGVVRSEWVLARYGQVIPTNWAMMDLYQAINTYAPLQYLVADAQNLIVKAALEKKVEWLFLVEQDNLLPPDCFLKFNDYMREGDVPIVSGLYFTKSVPPEPMVYRGAGTSFYTDWKIGDKVWCTGVPTGTLLVHCSILQKMWDDSPEYECQGTVTRRVFDAPARLWYDPEQQGFRTEVGTSDLDWCRKIIMGNYFEKAGWSKYQKMQFPFLIDTNIFVRHIDMDGRQFPLEIPSQFMPDDPPKEVMVKKDNLP